MADSPRDQNSRDTDLPNRFAGKAGSYTKHPIKEPALPANGAVSGERLRGASATPTNQASGFTGVLPGMTLAQPYPCAYYMRMKKTQRRPHESRV